MRSRPTRFQIVSRTYGYWVDKRTAKRRERHQRKAEAMVHSGRSTP